MAKVYDLSSYLEEEKAVIKFGDEEYEVSDGFNDLLKIDALTNRKEEMETTDFVREFLKISLGKEKAEELISRNYRTKVYIKIMECIEDVYSGNSEEMEGASISGTSLV